MTVGKENKRTAIYEEITFSGFPPLNARQLFLLPCGNSGRRQGFYICGVNKYIKYRRHKAGPDLVWDKTAKHDIIEGNALKGL